MEKLMTEFGKWMALNEKSCSEAAVDLGVSRAYISMLCTGKATPGLELAGEIEDWTKGEVPMRVWYEWIRQVKAAARAQAAANLAASTDQSAQ